MSDTVIYEAKYDLNKDGVIDERDVEVLKTVYGVVDPDNPLSVACDFDGNGKVNISDYGQLAIRAGLTGDPNPSPVIDKKLLAGAIVGAVLLLILVTKGHK